MSKLEDKNVMKLSRKDLGKRVRSSGRYVDDDDDDAFEGRPLLRAFFCDCDCTPGGARRAALYVIAS